MLARIKAVMRIGHSALDTEINNQIVSARKELVRVGVDVTMAASEDELIQGAVISYVCMQLSIGKKDQYDIYATSWEYQQDNLRKSDKYKAVIADV